MPENQEDCSKSDTMRGPGPIAGGQGPDLADAVTFCRRGLDEPLPPETTSAEGISWGGDAIGERGLDLVIDLGSPLFVDRVVLHQRLQSEASSTKSAGLPAPAAGPLGPDIETAEREVTVGVGRVVAFTRPAPGAPLALAARKAALDQGVLPDVITLELGVQASEVVLSLESYRREIRITGLEVWGGDLQEPRVYPQPHRFQPLPGPAFPLSRTAVIVAEPQAGEEVFLAAELLREELAETSGLSLRIAPHSGSLPAIRLSLGEQLGITSEGYRLRVTSDEVVLMGADRRGLIYGVHTLAQLASTAGPEGIEPCIVADEPKMGIRGVHLYMPSRENIPFFKRLIRHLLVPMRYNTIFLEVGAAMAFDRHPEINAAWVAAQARANRGEPSGSPHIQVGGGSYLTKSEVRDLVDYAEKHGMEVIPEIQSLSHVEFLTMAHPEIAESPGDGRMDCYCPQNERSYEILFDNIDEIVQVFHPRRYVHMGHDEAYTMCQCEKCRDIPKAQLFARDVNRIYQYLKSKGLGMMIWDDMVNTTRDFACPEALDLIPKNIVLLDFVWYDRMNVDTEDRLLERGFPVMIGNFYSSHFPRFASREGKPGLVGAEVSTWFTTSEDDYGRLGKLYDFIYSANMMWSSHYDDRLRWLYDRRISALLPRVRDALSGATYPSRCQDATFRPITLGSAASEPRRDPRGTLGGYDLSPLPLGEQTLGSVPFALGETVTVIATPRLREQAGCKEARLPFGQCCESVVFLQACTQPGAPSPYNGRGQPVAQYAYIYADGTRAEVTLEYGWQLAEWNRRHGAPLPHSHWRHSGYVATYPSLPFWQGKTPHGEDITLYGYEWINPHPEKVVSELEITAPAGAGDAALLLVAATAVCRSQNHSRATPQDRWTG